MLNPTPAEVLVDEFGVPYFLQDLRMTLEQFWYGLRDPIARGKHVLILLTRARPDDVFSFLSVEELVEIWPEVERHLAPQPQWAFWHWLVKEWEIGDWENEEVDLRSDQALLHVTGEGDICQQSPLQDILVSDLCVLAGGFNVQRLADVKVLLENGGDLIAALMEAPRKMIGFSPLLLAWRLHDLDLPSIGLELDLNANELNRLDRFKGWLVKRLLRSSRPLTLVC